MSGRLAHRARGLLAGVLVAAAIGVADGACADIGFARNGPFEICLNGAYAAWLQGQAELLVNEDRRAQSLNDASVAAWTVAALDDCRRKAAAEADTVERFGRYMVRWREHVFDAATSIRLRGQSD